MIIKNKINLCHLSLGILLFILFIFLILRASDKDRWSDWAGADAQSMLSHRHWYEEGWINNKFLFLPQGYFRDIRLLDEPALRHHAHGISPHASPTVGPRLWYTHYPPGYLIPYAFLYNFIHDNMFFMRALAIFFSISSLILMYVLFSKITCPAVSFWAVLFYGLSPAFLGYADTLSNQPIDDILRFAFMLAVVLSTKAVLPRPKRILKISAWVISFLLSLSSFDSVFFIYLWLIGWDLLERRGFKWKSYIIFALAPLSAHSLLFLQNVWYLGWKDAFLDIIGTFQIKGMYGWPLLARLVVLVPVVKDLFTNLFKPVELIVVLLVVYFIYIKILRHKDAYMPSFGLLVLLSSCGIIFGEVFPFAVLKIPSLARQIGPFAAVLAGGVTYSFWKVAKELFTVEQLRGKEHVSYSRSMNILYILLSGTVLFLFWSSFVFLDRSSTITKIISQKHSDVLLAKKIKTTPTKYEPVIFSLDGFQWADLSYVPGYPEIHPILEYAAGSKLILCFETPEGLSKDLLYLFSHSRYKFSPILITREPLAMEKIISSLNKNIDLRKFPLKASIISDRFVLDLTDFLSWDKKESGKI